MELQAVSVFPPEENRGRVIHDQDCLSSSSTAPEMGRKWKGLRRKVDEKSTFLRSWEAFCVNAFRKEMLVFWTVAGVVLGMGLGLILYSVHPSAVTINIVAYPGELLMRLLEELVLPLMAFALLSGVLSLRHTPSGSARVTRYAIGYYFCSMLLAVVEGIVLVLCLQPGKGSALGQLAASACTNGTTTAGTFKETAAAVEGTDPVDSILNLGRQLAPRNIVMAAAQGQYLGVIAFAIFFGSVLASMGEEGEPLVKIIEIGNTVLMKMILLIVWLTPLGIGSLVAGTILKSCNLGGLVHILGLYVATVLTGFILHAFLVLPLLLRVFSGKNPFRIARSFAPAFAMGFGTSSSAATMPVTMDCARQLGCDGAIVNFVVPLGCYINRDGAALYEAATVLFIAQVHGAELSLGMVLTVAFTATLAAMAGASIPMGALVSMITVLQAVGLEEYVADVAVVMAVDWFIGMFRTVVNIWGDSCATICVDAWVKARNREDEGREEGDYGSTREEAGAAEGELKVNEEEGANEECVPLKRWNM